MKDIYKDIAKVYKQTSTKKMLLIPAIKRVIPKAKNAQKCIDVGCGTGDFFGLITLKGYEYFGLDISKSMISVAKSKFPKGNFLLTSSTNFSNKYLCKFDTALINLLFESFKKRSDIVNTLKEVNKSLNKNGKLIVGLQYPCFDQYQRHGLFNKRNVRTKFKGYFKSPQKYHLDYKFDQGKAIFKAYHWTLNDYIESLLKTNFVITSLDECKPFRYSKNVSEQKYTDKSKYPTYLVITATKE